MVGNHGPIEPAERVLASHEADVGASGCGENVGRACGEGKAFDDDEGRVATHSGGLSAGQHGADYGQGYPASA